MAARIAGIVLPNEKRVEIALTYIHGVGLATSKKILKLTGIDPDKRTKELSSEEVNKIKEAIDKSGQKIEGELKREKMANIKRLKEIGSYRGSRHAKNLPVRGQRTKTNTRTVRGNTRKTMGSGRKTASQKT